MLICFCLLRALSQIRLRGEYLKFGSPLFKEVRCLYGLADQSVQSAG